MNWVMRHEFEMTMKWEKLNENNLQYMNNNLSYLIYLCKKNLQNKKVWPLQLCNWYSVQYLSFFFTVDKVFELLFYRWYSIWASLLPLIQYLSFSFTIDTVFELLFYEICSILKAIHF